jgi:hypothetical protein
MEEATSRLYSVDVREVVATCEVDAASMEVMSAVKVAAVCMVDVTAVFRLCGCWPRARCGCGGVTAGGGGGVEGGCGGGTLGSVDANRASGEAAAC